MIIMHPDKIAIYRFVGNGISKDLIHPHIGLPDVFVKVHISLVVEDRPENGICQTLCKLFIHCLMQNRIKDVASYAKTDGSNQTPTSRRGKSLQHYFLPEHLRNSSSRLGPGY